ncbi:unnamed protein product [Miscanthus lutarioriparius]|uniref:Leucine-rich repeat-containing N-terminal plant-type domain-containing protein n=1 Tax=Miscanthus lutarioriparius TaxID=422564 RepID=A0A811PVR0_9POAL|nr:unnamed protein product [Miscanthus lutarioriparius]
MQPLHFSYKKYNISLPLPVLAVSLVLLLSLATPISSCTEQEKKSLLQFLAGLSQDSGLAKSWQEEGTDCCKWEGVTCNGNKTVIEVSLPSRGLEGSITSLGNLTGLQHLNLSYNSLSGNLPQELVSSSSIIVLDISFNQISGDLHELPSSTSSQPLKVLNISSNLFTGQFTIATWKGMENLVALNASNNSFTGQIPSHFCNISPNFAILELCYNKLSGSIPPGLSNCSKLKVLKAGHNHLSGTLPDELFNGTLLEHLTFSSNGLHGILEGTHIANLTNLVILDLGENNFRGKVPESLVQLKKLQELHSGYNNLSGELPSALSNCTNLTNIDLKNNNFSGELTKVNFSNLPNLQILDLMENNFSGKIAETIYSCHKLTALRLSSNNFHGQLSEGLGNLKSLSFLSLTGNSFTNLANALQILKSSKNLTTLLIGLNFMNETMPDDERIDGFENLQVLSLTGCSLLGEIPYWLSKLTNLQMLYLDGNQLTGPIPDWISSLNFLFYLDISNNSLTGGIPTALTEMPMLKSEKTAAPLDPRVFEVPIYLGTSLQYRKVNAFPILLDLGNNNFTGVIPPEIGLLKEIQSLNLNFNKLYGDIPQSISNLTNLLELDLSNNYLTGAIPGALNNLHFLTEFNVSFNDLEGPVPTTGQFSTFTNSSFGGNPKLCGPMLIHQCNSAEQGPVPTVYENQGGSKSIFTITFSLFFGLGVLYDQIVLSRYFG